MRRPEEINRIIIDHISQVLFTQSQATKANLVQEGISQDRIFIVGHPVVDASLQNLQLAKSRNILTSLNINVPYIIVTAHRSENVDNPKRLKLLLELLKFGHEMGYKIIFPVHPRTKQKIIEFKLLSQFEEIAHIIPPQGYLDFLQLLNNCELVITDSGGIQKEVATLQKPCLYFHTSTGSWEGLDTFLFLGGYELKELRALMEKLLSDPKIRNKIKSSPNPYGNGTTGQQMLSVLEKLHKTGKLTLQTFRSPSAFKAVLEKRDVT